MSERVIGYREHLDGGRVEVTPWIPPTPEAAAALPPLPDPPARPVPVRTTVPEAIQQAPSASAAPGADPGASADPKPASAAPESASPRRRPPPRPAWIPEGSDQALVWEHPEAAAALARMAVHGAWPPTEDPPGLHDAALWMIRLGSEVAGEVYRWLSEVEVEALTRELAGIVEPPLEEEERVGERFGRHLRAGSGLHVGGIEFARLPLERACGPRKACEILDRVVRGGAPGFDDLRDLPADTVASFVGHEHPQTVALLLAQLDPERAAAILTHLPEVTQNDVAYRVATMESVTPQVIQQLDQALSASLRDVVGGNLAAGGPKVLAHVINVAGASLEGRLLAHLDRLDGAVAERVRNLMFTYADIERLSDADIQVLLKEVSFDDLVVALKGTRHSLRERIRGLVGDQAWEKLAAALAARGPTRASDVEEVQIRIVQQARRLEEQGRVTIVRGDTGPWL